MLPASRKTLKLGSEYPTEYPERGMLGETEYTLHPFLKTKSSKPHVYFTPNTVIRTSHNSGAQF